MIRRFAWIAGPLAILALAGLLRFTH
jgi:hypothetical protein